jgi:integrase
MARTGQNLLSDLKIKSTRAGTKTIKLRDGAGLFLVIEPSGKRWWKFRAVFAKKETSFSFGEYPSVTLAQARKERDKASTQIQNKIDPGVSRRVEKAIREKIEGVGSFEAVAREWHERNKPKWAESHREALLKRFTRHVFPYIGARPIGEITSPEMLAVLRRIEKRAPETARQTKFSCGQVFRYAIASGYAATDPTAALKEALSPAVSKHMAAPTDPKDVAPLLRMLDGYTGSLIVQCALRLAPLVFVRPGELRQAEWADIDLEQAEWRYLVTKTNTEHIVPLSQQAVKILQELLPITGMGKYVFPSARSKDDPMSNNAVNAAMRRMGIDTQNELTGHGFRAMARTILDEVLGFRPDFIEHQLAHTVKDPLGRAYNRTAHLPARKGMMQAWADYLDVLKKK